MVDRELTDLYLNMKHKTFLSHWLWPWTYSVCEQTLWFSKSEHLECLADSTIIKWLLIRGVPIADSQLVWFMNTVFSSIPITGEIERSAGMPFDLLQV